jgi:hypothetical protein
MKRGRMGIFETKRRRNVVFQIERGRMHLSVIEKEEWKPFKYRVSHPLVRLSTSERNCAPSIEPERTRDCNNEDLTQSTRFITPTHPGKSVFDLTGLETIR